MILAGGPKPNVEPMLGLPLSPTEPAAARGGAMYPARIRHRCRRALPALMLEAHRHHLLTAPKVGPRTRRGSIAAVGGGPRPTRICHPRRASPHALPKERPHTPRGSAATGGGPHPTCHARICQRCRRWWVCPAAGGGVACRIGSAAATRVVAAPHHQRRASPRAHPTEEGLVP